MAESVVRDVWLDAKNNPVAPNTPGATRHRIRFDPDGNVYQQDWTPAKPTGGLWEGGPGSTPPGPDDGTWSAPYWVKKDEPERDAPVAANTSAPLIVTRKADGTLGEEPNPNYIEPKASAAAEWTTKTDDAGNTWRVNEVTGQKEKLFEAGPDNTIWTNPSTGAQWLMDKRTGGLVKQLSGDIAGYRPSGVPAPPSQGSPAEWARIAMEREKMQQPSFQTQDRTMVKIAPDGTVTPVYEFPEKQPSQWERDTQNRQYDWWKQQEEGQNERRRQDAEDAMRRQRLTSAVGLAGNIADATQKAVPYAMLPGQKYFLGAEPGGVYENIAKMSGRGFDPETMRPNPIKFDPLEAWRLAQGVLGVE